LPSQQNPDHAAEMLARPKASLQQLSLRVDQAVAPMSPNYPARSEFFKTD
jgi:hypothetical protein